MGITYFNYLLYSKYINIYAHKLCIITVKWLTDALAWLTGASEPHVSKKEVSLSLSIEQLPPVPSSANACGALVGVSDTVNWCYDRILTSLQFATDSSKRKTMLLISRCPRGGKTTVLRELHARLQSEGIGVISVSFNGVSGFDSLKGETHSDSLFRLITNQLDKDIGTQTLRVTDWEQLNTFIGNTPFVLMIDELNVLCEVVGSELAGVLKRYFLDPHNRQLVVTSHQPYVEDNTSTLVDKVWSDSVTALSDRGMTLVPMPLCANVPLLQNMDMVRCSGITASLAAFYGYVPSLMYAVLMQGEESPAIKFSKVIKQPSSKYKEVVDFAVTLITGIPCPSLKPFFCFTSAVGDEPFAGIRMRWPLCYVSCILKNYPGCELYSDMANLIDNLGQSCSTVGDGMVWEQCVRLAIVLRFLLAAEREFDVPFNLCRKNEATGAAIKIMSLGVGIKSVEKSKGVIFSNSKHFPENTLVLYLPTEATLEQFDGYCVRYDRCEVQSVCGFQCKGGRQGASGNVPDWINRGGHLLRGCAPKQCRNDGQQDNGWTYYNSENTDDFLGWTLRLLRTLPSDGTQMFSAASNS